MGSEHAGDWTIEEKIERFDTVRVAGRKSKRCF